MLKSIWRSRGLQLVLGTLLAWYLRLARWTSRIDIDEPALAVAEGEMPYILAMWHGQHFMVPFLQKPHYRFSVLISRHGDGEVNAIAASHFNIGLVRGSGAQRPDQIRKRGGSQAMRAMLAALKRGECMSLTADVPKIARVVGPGIVVLARLSGRPIVPIAIVSNRRLIARSWDRACIGLPFGHCAVRFGAPIFVPRDADPATLEALRRQLEDTLDDIHREAHAQLGVADPLAGRPEVAAARAVARAGGGTPAGFPA
jgi:lysophospholipid acyltransferase (LPLAT)-like uncharacterized protein